MKPILFNTDMVQALLNGRKTVTLRPVKPQPEGAHEIFGPSEENDGTFEFFCGGFDGEKFSDWITAVKMPCQPGDILYVRETWCEQNSEEYPFVYRASVQTPDAWRGQWRPSIHMPKEAARIFLQVTDVRVERLQDITDEDIVAEGLEIGCYIEEIWDRTIKPADRALYGWDSNPWVWVIEFERCENPEVCL